MKNNQPVTQCFSTRPTGFIRRMWVLGLLVILACGSGGEKKIGYIDTGELLNRFDPALQARTELKGATEKWQGTVDEMSKELDALRQQFISDSARLSASRQKNLREQIAEKEQAYVQFVQEANQRAAALEAEKMQPVYRQLNTVLHEYGKQHGYYIIWGATPDGNIVYADTTSNLTEDVLAYIAERKAVSSSE